MPSIDATVYDDFLPRYLAAFDHIPGWCSPEALLMFLAYHQLLTEEGIAGDTLEIGVHHGRSAIGIAAMRHAEGRFVAIDLFEELQAKNVSRSGSGDRRRFLEHMGRFYDDLSFLTTVVAPSTTLRPEELGRTFTFCHIDGGHSVEETYADLELSAEITVPGGLIALDDYFNPAFPGVGEAAARFSVAHAGVLRPLAIGFNTVLFQREPTPFDLDARFIERYPQVRSIQTRLWRTAVPLFDGAFAACFDLARSGVGRLLPAERGIVAARSQPAPQRLIAPPAEDRAHRQGTDVTVPPLPEHFLSDYFSLFESIPGWFSPDAYLVVAAYNQLLADAGVAGDVLEIGVYHGLSAIGFAALRGQGKRFVAVDLFGKPSQAHEDRSLFGDVASFMENMGRCHDDLSFVTAIAAASKTLQPEDLGFDFAVCHIDGGHSAPDVYADLQLCAAVSKPGALIVLDDYSSPAFPGVAEAALKFNLDAAGTLRPVAIGFNKAIFQREPAPFDLNARLFAAFPHLCTRAVLLWNLPVPLFDMSLRPFIDLARSTPRRLVGAAGQIAARIEPVEPRVTGPAGGIVEVPIRVTNLSRIPLSCEQAPFGLSYHLRTAGHALMKHDNPRAYFEDPLAPHHSRLVRFRVRVPDEPGRYELEFDIVWEGILWMKDVRNPTAAVALTAVTTAGEASGASAVETV